MKLLEKELDKLIQLWAVKQCSQVSKKKAECGHHIIPRANKLFRWNLQNIMPLTYNEHYDLHSNSIDYRNLKQKEFEEENRNKSIKDYLIRKGITFDEFLKESKSKLMGEIKNC